MLLGAYEAVAVGSGGGLVHGSAAGHLGLEVILPCSVFAIESLFSPIVLCCVAVYCEYVKHTHSTSVTGTIA